jgi:microcystin degradation protein MlrC
VTWDEKIPAGKCLRVAAGAEGEGIGLLARMIERATGNELDRTYADRAIVMHACAAAGAARLIRIELRASAGKLDALVGERVTE